MCSFDGPERRTAILNCYLTRIIICVFARAAVGSRSLNTHNMDVIFLYVHSAGWRNVNAMHPLIINSKRNVNVVLLSDMMAHSLSKKKWCTFGNLGVALENASQLNPCSSKMHPQLSLRQMDAIVPAEHILQALLCQRWSSSWHEAMR